MRHIIFPAICSLLLAFTGCMSLPTVDLSALQSPGPVTSITAAWEPAVSNDNQPMRGFGGRVYFYDAENRPVKINGRVVVYAFDEKGRAKSDSRPSEGFEFDEKTLNSKGVYKKSKLGHSYNLWIPWDAAGPEGEAKKISLIVRYIPKQGAQAVSSQTTAYLPGRNSPALMVAQMEQQQERPSPVPERARLTEERLIESNANRPRALQSVIIR